MDALLLSCARVFFTIFFHDVNAALCILVAILRSSKNKNKYMFLRSWNRFTSRRNTHHPDPQYRFMWRPCSRRWINVIDPSRLTAITNFIRGSCSLVVQMHPLKIVLPVEWIYGSCAQNAGMLHDVRRPPPVKATAERWKNQRQDSCYLLDRLWIIISFFGEEK